MLLVALSIEITKEVENHRPLVAMFDSHGLANIILYLIRTNDTARP